MLSSFLVFAAFNLELVMLRGAGTGVTLGSSVGVDCSPAVKHIVTLSNSG